MIVAVSPYHLTTREPPALAALLLASQVVTLMPAASDGDAASAAARVKPYADLARAWAWATPLFDAGVIAPRRRADAPEADIRAVLHRLTTDERYAALRAVLADADESDDRRLEAVASDILKGGPDPSRSVPVAAALDRYAVRHGAFVARSAGVSVAQAAELRTGTTLATVAMPLFVQADADRLLHAREVLARPLAALRECCDAIPRAVRDAPQGAAPHVDALTHAAETYAGAFERARPHLVERCGDDDVRLVESVAMVSLVALPADAVLTGGLAALQSLSPRRAAPTSISAATLPATYDEVEGRYVAALVVKVLGRR